MDYFVMKSEVEPELDSSFDGGAWKNADTVKLTHFRPESSSHKPEVQAKLLYSEKGLYGRFKVNDRYVRAVATAYGERVCSDSCVEFFFQPGPVKGYFNFECNCGGTFLCRYSRYDNGMETRNVMTMTEDDKKYFRIYHSMPTVVDPEIQEPVEWHIVFFIDFGLIEKCQKNYLKSAPGVKWTANFYKCADDTSHPHWGSWAPISTFNFHQPECFETIKFM